MHTESGEGGDEPISTSVRCLFAVAVFGLAALPWAADAPAERPAAVVAYPSSQSITASGRLPPAGKRDLVYHAAIGEREGALLVVRAAGRIAVAVEAASLGGISVRLFFAHFVAAGGRQVPDALEPWEGTARAAEKTNQPVLVQVEVPYGTRPGSYAGAVVVTADGRPTRVPLRVEVFPMSIPRPGRRIGSLLTSFYVSPQSYVSKAEQLFDFRTHEQRIAANRSLFALLGAYRISPSSWGFAEPRGPRGYASSRKWWRDSAGNFVGQLRATPGFSAMRIPISSNRTSERNYIAGISPFRPQTWCSYLRRVRAFWARHQALRAESIAYLYGFEEPGLVGQRVVARQARVLHRCFPGGMQLMTGNPSRANAFLRDGKGDDLDIWTVLSRRYYGRFASAGRDRARGYLKMINRVRARGKMVWSYTYTATAGTPGFAATEPLSNPRMLMLWNALEGIEGVLYGQGTTSYWKANPLESIGTGEFVLLYPGRSGPIASARLEQIRDGIEDWAIFNRVRERRGADEVRAILGRAGLFSATRARVQLACTLGCELQSRTKYAWPRWSRDASTPRRIEAAKVAALTLAR
jgi:hypothetical protein